MLKSKFICLCKNECEWNVCKCVWWCLAFEHSYFYNKVHIGQYVWPAPHISVNHSQKIKTESNKRWSFIRSSHFECSKLQLKTKKKTTWSLPPKWNPFSRPLEKTHSPLQVQASQHRKFVKWNPCRRRTILKIRYGKRPTGLAAAGKHLKPVFFDGALDGLW